jgi:hypothetical protein
MSENGGQLRCNSEPATTPRQVNLTLFWPCPAHSGAERNADFHLRALCRVENQHVVSDAPRPAVKPCPGLRNTSHAPDQIGRGWLSALFDRRRGSHGNTHFLRRVGDSGKIEEVGVEPSADAVKVSERGKCGNPLALDLELKPWRCAPNWLDRLTVRA